MALEDYIIASDQQLIERVLGGDASAFEHLFNRYRDSILQLYLQKTGGNIDDSNDLLQETFVKIYLNLQRYSDQYTFGQWIYTIARNTFIDYVRRKRDDTVSIDSLREASGISTWNEPNPEERMITHQNRARIEAFLDRMSPRYKELIELRFSRSTPTKRSPLTSICPWHRQDSDSPGPGTAVPIYLERRGIAEPPTHIPPLGASFNSPNPILNPSRPLSTHLAFILYGFLRAAITIHF